MCFFQAYRLEPLISEDYCSIPPVQLPRYDSKQTADVKPGKTRATGKWGGLFASYRVGFAKQKPEAEEADDRSAGANSVENGDEDEVVIVHNATAADNIRGTNFFLQQTRFLRDVHRSLWNCLMKKKFFSPTNELIHSNEIDII